MLQTPHCVVFFNFLSLETNHNGEILLQVTELNSVDSVSVIAAQRFTSVTQGQKFLKSVFAFRHCTSVTLNDDLKHRMAHFFILFKLMLSTSNYSRKGE